MFALPKEFGLFRCVTHLENGFAIKDVGETAFCRPEASETDSL